MIAGIDLGTTNSVLAYIKNNEAKCVTFNFGSNLFPSVYFFDGSNEYVGQSALDMEQENPFFMVKSSKRLMGTDHVYSYVNNLTPVDIAAKILHAMTQEASAVLGEAIKQVVIWNPDKDYGSVHLNYHGIPLRRVLGAVLFDLNVKFDEVITIGEDILL
jgi:molecular chaperone DnaK (HSP70)